jgi:hypothetical protein
LSALHFGHFHISAFSDQGAYTKRRVLSTQFIGLPWQNVSMLMFEADRPEYIDSRCAVLCLSSVAFAEGSGLANTCAFASRPISV